MNSNRILYQTKFVEDKYVHIIRIRTPQSNHPAFSVLNVSKTRFADQTLLMQF